MKKNLLSVVMLSTLAVLANACGKDQPAPTPAPQVAPAPAPAVPNPNVNPNNPNGNFGNLPQNGWGTYGQLNGGMLYVYSNGAQIYSGSPCGLSWLNGVQVAKYTLNGQIYVVGINAYTYPGAFGYGYYPWSHAGYFGGQFYGFVHF